MQRIVCCLLLSAQLFLFLVIPVNGYAVEQALTLGYGFAELNSHVPGGEVEGGKIYDFFQVSYLYEIPHWERFSFIAEPYAAYINRPESGADGGFDLLMRWYPSGQERKGLFFDVGAGAAYTSVAFREQGTHLLGILVGGIGFRYRTFFIEDRFRHYSNGHTSYPNRSVNANIVMVGKYF